MVSPKRKRKHPIQRTRTWRAVDALLKPLGPASTIIRRLEREHGISLSLRAVYNWRARGVSEECTAAIAAMAGVPVEVVLRASGKL